MEKYIREGGDFVREIKFRAWDEKNKRWYKDSDPDCVLEFDGSITQINVVGEYDGELFYSFDDKKGLILVQYTGLKDKNGKEIYEGDILRTWEQEEYVPDRDSGGGIVGYDKIDGFSQLGIVSYHSASFIYTTKKHLKGRKEEINIPIDWLQDFVIAGNIFENPELLEEK